MADITFILDRAGGADILRNNQILQQLENSTFNELLATIESQFFQVFGVEGHFALTDFTTDRSNAKIQATDAHTAAILKANPGWLSTFISNITI